MKKQKSIKLNFIMNVILTMSSILFPLITFPYVSRILLPEGTGKVAFAVSLISYFALFSQLGIPTYGIRACAKVRDNKFELSRTVQELMIINVVMAAVVYVFLFASIAFINRLKEERMLYVILSLTILFNAIGMEWLYRGLEHYTYITVRSVFFKLIALLATFVLIHRKEDYVIYGALTILASSASNILNFIHVHKFIILRPLGNYHFKKHIKAVAIFFAMSVATTIYTHIDSTMLGIMVNNTAVGYYDAAVKVRTTLLSIVTSLGAVLLPRASYYIELGMMNEFKHISQKALQFVVLLATPLTVYFFLFASPCIHLLSGPAYDGAVLPMQIIMPTVLIVGITNIFGIQMLVPLGKEKIVLYSEITGALTDLLLNTLLIPILGPSGAAIGTLAAEIAVFCMQFAALGEDATTMFKSIGYCKIAVALLLSVSCAVLTLFVHLGNFMTLALSAVIFFSVYGLLLLLMKEQLINEIYNGIIAKMRHK